MIFFLGKQSCMSLNKSYDIIQKSQTKYCPLFSMLEINKRIELSSGKVRTLKISHFVCNLALVSIFPCHFYMPLESSQNYY